MMLLISHHLHWVNMMQKKVSRLTLFSSSMLCKSRIMCETQTWSFWCNRQHDMLGQPVSKLAINNHTTHTD